VTRIYQIILEISGILGYYHYHYYQYYYHLPFSFRIIGIFQPPFIVNLNSSSSSLLPTAAIPICSCLPYFIVKEVLKLVAVVVGLFIAGLVYLQYQHVIIIDWTPIWSHCTILQLIILARLVLLME
jgi:hypothetical protein